MLAVQAYINLKSKMTLQFQLLKVAKEATNNNEEKRDTFLFWDNYMKNDLDSAYAEFEEVIQMNRKAPRRYVIQSHAKQAQYFNYSKGDTLVFLKPLTPFLKIEKTDPFRCFKSPNGIVL